MSAKIAPTSVLGLGYYIVCEAATGMTVGKRLVGERGVSDRTAWRLLARLRAEGSLPADLVLKEVSPSLTVSAIG